MRLLISFASLFLAVILLQLSSGALGPLDALSGIALGFTRSEIGLLGSAHFLGFFIGCWLAPRLMGNVGHSRAFAVFTASGAIGILAHMMILDPTAWAVMRIASGMCVAGCYTVIEAWLQAKVTNASRPCAWPTSSAPMSSTARLRASSLKSLERQRKSTRSQTSCARWA